MGGDLFDRCADWTSEADAILGYSIRDLCLNDPRGELGLTAFTQPALFVVNALMYRARRDWRRAGAAFVAGHSLGEMRRAAGRRCVRLRDGCAPGPATRRVDGPLGGRDVGRHRPRSLAHSADAAGQRRGPRVDVANFNSQEQTVLAGPKETGSAAVKPHLEAAGARAVIPLNITPLPLRYMRKAQAEFAGVLRDVTFAPPGIPVISNVHARPTRANRSGRRCLSRSVRPVAGDDSVFAGAAGAAVRRDWPWHRADEARRESRKDEKLKEAGSQRSDKPEA